MICTALTDEVMACMFNARDRDNLVKIAGEWSCHIDQAFQTITTRALSDKAVQLADEKAERIGDRRGD